MRQGIRHKTHELVVDDSLATKIDAMTNKFVNLTRPILLYLPSETRLLLSLLSRKILSILVEVKRTSLLSSLSVETVEATAIFPDAADSFAFDNLVSHIVLMCLLVSVVCIAM